MASRECQYLSDGKGKDLGQRLKRQGQASIGGDPGGGDTVEAQRRCSFRKTKMVRVKWQLELPPVSRRGAWCSGFYEGKTKQNYC